MAPRRSRNLLRTGKRRWPYGRVPGTASTSSSHPVRPFGGPASGADAQGPPSGSVSVAVAALSRISRGGHTAESVAACSSSRLLLLGCQNAARFWSRPWVWAGSQACLVPRTQVHKLRGPRGWQRRHRARQVTRRWSRKAKGCRGIDPSPPWKRKAKSGVNLGLATNAAEALFQYGSFRNDLDQK